VRHKYYSKQAGLSLIELMVSIAISLLLLLAISSYFFSSIGSQKNTLMELNLSKELRQTENIITSELRRAGFHPQLAGFTPNTAALKPVIPNANCILTSYYNTSGSELNYSGFRLISNRIQMRNSSTGKCSDAADSTNWESITDPIRVKVNSFSLTSDTSSPADISINYEASINKNDGTKISNANEQTKIKVENLSIHMFNVAAIATSE
jgi:prepilin-type N-terminal cleavage/methylation domain-containing protein